LSECGPRGYKRKIIYSIETRADAGGLGEQRNPKAQLVLRFGSTGRRPRAEDVVQGRVCVAAER
jgi:hypothetical protein